MFNWYTIVKLQVLILNVQINARDAKTRMRICINIENLIYFTQF